MRHGQAVSNVKQITSCWPEKFKNPLTKEGIKGAKESAKKLEKENIDLIFYSPLLRTKMTAEIVGKILGIKPKTDMRLREQGAGIFNGQPFHHLISFFGEKNYQRFKKRPKNGETYVEIEKRMVECLKSIDKKYKNKNILIVSHELPLLLLDCVVKGIPNKDFYSKREKLATAEIRKLN
jgi:broad specificity phosphatase PhoE